MKIKVSQLKKMISEVVQENDLAAPASYMHNGYVLWSRLKNDIIDMIQDEYDAAVEGLTSKMKAAGGPPPAPYEYYEDAAEDIATKHAKNKLKETFKEVAEHFNYKL